MHEQFDNNGPKIARDNVTMPVHICTSINHYHISSLHHHYIMIGTSSYHHIVSSYCTIVIMLSKTVALLKRALALLCFIQTMVQHHNNSKASLSLVLVLSNYLQPVTVTDCKVSSASTFRSSYPTKSARLFSKVLELTRFHWLAFRSDQ